MRNTILYLRIIGALSAAGGGLLFWYGGKEIPFNLYGLTLSIPLEYIFIILGLLLLFLPLLFIVMFALLLPEKWEKRLLDYADSLDPEIQQLKENSNPANLSTLLYSHIHRTNKRSYIFIFIAVIFVFGVLPLLFKNAIQKSQLEHESERLVSLVQESRINFAAGDHIREYLHEADGVIPSKPTATRHIYEILKEIYDDPSIKDSYAFATAVNKVYDKRIKSHTTEAGVLDMDSFKVQKASSEADLAPITYLTLLAIICNVEGDHGSNVDPYVQGRQLLRSAISQLKKTDKAPATRNASGVNYAGLLKTYPEFEKKFQNEQSARNLQSLLGINGIPSQLLLLRQANNEYEEAGAQSLTNLAKARSINNQIDVLLTFLYRVHVEKQSTHDMIRDDTDRDFMENQLAVRQPDMNVDQQKLLVILNGYMSKINEALKLSSEPEFFFTRAQILSVGAELSENNKLADSYWSDSDARARDALRDLQTAASMHLAKRYFERKLQIEQFKLGWLWRTNHVPELEQLGR